MPNMIVLGGGAFGKCFGPKSKALMSEFSVLIKELPRLFHHMKTQLEDAIYEPESRHFTKHWICKHLDIPASRTMRHKFLVL